MPIVLVESQIQQHLSAWYEQRLIRIFNDGALLQSPLHETELLDSLLAGEVAFDCIRHLDREECCTCGLVDVTNPQDLCNHNVVGLPA